MSDGELHRCPALQLSTARGGVSRAAAKRRSMNEKQPERREHLNFWNARIALGWTKTIPQTIQHSEPLAERRKDDSGDTWLVPR
jgi:hypothetical protein